MLSQIRTIYRRPLTRRLNDRNRDHAPLTGIYTPVAIENNIATKYFNEFINLTKAQTSNTLIALVIL